ncbi:plasma membrane proteolipid 3 [Phlyctema vagabunda]|uniref:Plasma membrane proteolipid 3 n=1 Tax=Phlyctema vagabunda TaxID=108571 RepID=A0ABR4PVL7_9HELO
MGLFLERILVTIVNIFCPPLGVMLVAGVGADALVNTLWFLAGVIPGHVHAFYITWTYFSRRRKVAKGRYPGGRKAGIYSERVWNGDASNQHVRELWIAEQRKKEEELMRKRSRSHKSWRK